MSRSCWLLLPCAGHRRAGRGSCLVVQATWTTHVPIGHRIRTRQYNANRYAVVGVVCRPGVARYCSKSHQGTPAPVRVLEAQSGAYVSQPHWLETVRGSEKPLLPDAPDPWGRARWSPRSWDRTGPTLYPKARTRRRVQPRDRARQSSHPWGRTSRLGDR